jgi:hypothetical protein
MRVRPFKVDEGTSLILRQMHLDETDKAARAEAEELSGELGGCPLAISHYVGFCVASHMSLGEVLRTFQQRSMSAEIWSCNSNVSVLQYERTLGTVWDTALNSLDDEAKDLLDVLAFLNPDCIPEDLLKSTSSHPTTESGLFDSFK